MAWSIFYFWGCQSAVISLDTLGEEDTESMMMLEPTEDQGPDDGRSMVIIGPQGPTGQESPTAQAPKRSPPSYNTHGGLRKRRRGASNQHKPLPNKPQDIQVLCRVIVFIFTALTIIGRPLHFSMPAVFKFCVLESFSPQITTSELINQESGTPFFLRSDAFSVHIFIDVGLILSRLDCNDHTHS